MLRTTRICIRQFEPALRKFYHAIRCASQWNLTTADSAPLVSLTPCNNACLSEDLKSLALLPDVCQRKSLNHSPLLQTESCPLITVSSSRQNMCINLKGSTTVYEGIGFMKLPGLDADVRIGQPQTNNLIHVIQFVILCYFFICTIVMFMLPARDRLSCRSLPQPEPGYTSY